jgi:hypothetical protein
MPQPPKFDTRRRNPRAGPVQLPAEGRRGRPPVWPLSALPSAEQRALWAKLWHTPHAVAWDRLGWTRVVARYVLVVLEAEAELDAKVLAQAVVLEDRLGLTPKAMRLLLWEITSDEVTSQRQAGGRYAGLEVVDAG